MLNLQVCISNSLTAATHKEITNELPVYYIPKIKNKYKPNVNHLPIYSKYKIEGINC